VNEQRNWVLANKELPLSSPWTGPYQIKEVGNINDGKKNTLPFFN
jgi:hypothetical protein